MAEVVSTPCAPPLAMGKIQPTKRMPGGIGYDEEMCRQLVDEPSEIETDVESHDVHSDNGASHTSDSGPDVPRTPPTLDTSAALALTAMPQRRARAAPPEELIIVQPSLKKQHYHPYNLQIQLLSRSRTGSNPSSELGHGGGRSRSNSGSSTTPVADLRRSNSSSSSRSGASDMSSSSNGASARRAIALYNLDYHHIRTTHIVDAGTDQNVAKFTRKGVEIEGFGLLQPQEMLYTAGRRTPPHAALAQVHADAHEDARGSSESLGVSDDAVDKAVLSTGEPNKVLRSKFFSRLRKFGSQLRSTGVGEEPTGLKRAQSMRTVPRNAGPSTMEPLRRTDSHDALTPTAVSPTAPTHASAMHSHSIPQLVPGAGVAHGKTTRAYVWEVKRWARDEELGTAATPAHADTNPILTRIWRQFNDHARQGHGIAAPPAHTIRPTFEWVRDSGGTTSPKATNSPLPTPDNEVVPRTTPTSPDSLRAPPLPPIEERSVSRSRGGRSPSPATSPSRHGWGCGATESDTELQYCSWTCFLGLDEATRIPIGQLRPAPHHPLVVCHLSLPSPLPDLRNTGIGQDGHGFSREELRDIVVVTSVHLVIRESLGSLQGSP